MIADQARKRSGAALAQAVALWEKANDLASSARHLSLDPQSTVFELSGLLAALAANDGKRPHRESEGVYRQPQPR